MGNLEHPAKLRSRKLKVGASRSIPPSFPRDLKEFFSTPWLEGSGSHIAFEHLAGKPVLFFVLYGSSSGQQTLDPEIEARRSKVIQRLAADAGCTTVFLEGSPAGQESKKRSSFVQRDAGEEPGGLKAEEHAQARSKVPITLVGIDHWPLYSESADALAEWRGKEKMARSALAVLDQHITTARAGCSSELGKILQARQSFKVGELSLKQYVPFLHAEAEGASASLKGRDSFLTLWQVMSQEADIDFDAAERERTLLMNELGPALTDPKQWIGRSLNEVGPSSLPEPTTIDEIENQAKLLDMHLRSSPEKMRAFHESQFYRTAMYGAYRKGLDGLEKPNATLNHCCPR